MTHKKIKLIPFDKIIQKELNSHAFKKTYDEELTRLRITHQIKTIRIKKNMSQVDLATKAVMPQSVIARIESGKHSFTFGTLDKIAHVLGKKIELR